MKIIKFGGTSLADWKSIEKAAEIVRNDENIKAVVVSAPGKRFSEDEKITDLLYKCKAASDENGKYESYFNIIKERFKGIVKSLSLKIPIEEELLKIENNIQILNKDYLASRGEYLMAKIFAEKTGFEFIDAADLIKFNMDGSFNLKKSQKYIKKISDKISNGVVIPGFYGSMPCGGIKTFTRGGSDFTGAVLASATDTVVYENWTDVNGFFACDPKILEDGCLIDEVTYRELRDLSYMGASVLHPDSIFPIYEKAVPINIKNTFNCKKQGTMIVKNRTKKNATIITSITGKKEMAKINIAISMLSDKVSALKKLCNLLAENKIIAENVLMSVDAISVITENKSIKSKEEIIIKSLTEKLNADSVSFEDNIAVLAVVGENLSKKDGIYKRLFFALDKSQVEIKFIDCGSSDSNILIGVRNSDFSCAVKAVYHEFFKCHSRTKYCYDKNE